MKTAGRMISRRTLFGLLASSLILATPVSAAAADSRTVTFTIKDAIFPPEADEVITVTINQLSVGTVRLGPQKTTDQFTATIPAADAYHYELCGHSTIARGDGKAVTMKIDNGGTLNYLDGRVLGIFDDDLTLSYLRDMQLDDRSEVQPAITTGRSCPDTVS